MAQKENELPTEETKEIEIQEVAEQDVEVAEQDVEVKASKKDGETLAQMRHAHKIKKIQECMSKDVPWKHDNSLSTTDHYCEITSIFFIVLKFIVFMLPLFILAFPVAFASWLYAKCMKTPTETVVRDCRFVAYCTLMMPFCLPFILMTIVAYLFDSIFYYLFSVPFYMYRLCSDKNASIKSSWDSIRPYRRGPSTFVHMIDIFVCLVGQTLREGLLSSTFDVACMIVIIPWVKYYINTNPWLYNLEERFIQQITTSMKDMPVPEVTGAIRDIISRSKQPKDIETDEEHWSFVPHYPYPPSGRNWALGMQCGGKPYMGFYLLVHVTHALKMNTMEKRDPNYFVFSNCVEEPIYRVMLWYNNPYHLFTGFVEASVSTGGKYQPDKIYGGEHPMWLVTGRSPFLADRTSKTGPGWIDKFFDWWLPYFVFEVRKVLRGEEYAKKHFETVISEDGISRPAGIEDQ